ITKAIVAKLRQRKAPTAFKWVKGHDGHELNEGADKLAGRGAEKTTHDDVSLEIPPELKIVGARLNLITQKTAYRAIRVNKARTTKKRAPTVRNIEKIKDDFNLAFGTKLREETIWKAVRKREKITREAAQWMWMSIHDAYMIGNNWLKPNMPDDLKKRAICKACGQIETMEHVLFTCTATGRETIWKALNAMCEATGMPEIVPDWGSIFAAGAIELKQEGNDERDTAGEMRWATLATEAAHLVWKLRCERVIANEGREHSEREVTQRWNATIDRRLDLDRRTAAQMVGKRRKQTIARVEYTWSPLLEDSENLPDDWVTSCGVLVGIKK
ncbi:uncharacterized protein BXZ73DRAFT_33673, partial [Epithele typhae]|uniref:uncharacterized protein n=1 Tax=Epithele typhae TaxID=378194 RepID=UPI002008A04A